MIVTKLYIYTKQKNKSCGFGPNLSNEFTFEEEQVWIKDSSIITITEIKLDLEKEIEKKVLEYIKERNKILVAVTFENGSTMNNVMVNNLMEIIPKQS